MNILNNNTKALGELNQSALKPQGSGIGSMLSPQPNPYQLPQPQQNATPAFNNPMVQQPSQQPIAQLMGQDVNMPQNDLESMIMRLLQNQQQQPTASGLMPLRGK